MIKKVADNVWKLSADSNVYFLDYGEPILIDTSSRACRNTVSLFLSKVVDFEKVKKVVFTHLHYDHIGNFDLFPNAEFFASKEEIDDFHKNPNGTVLDEQMAGRLKVKLNVIGDEFAGMKVLKTPGHTRGSICLWDEKKKILFSGDTIFPDGMVGRTDLPTSVPGQMQETLMDLISFNYKILCPGHG